jgi:hypothetical protein
MEIQKLLIIIDKSDKTALVYDEKKTKLGEILNLSLPIIQQEAENFKTDDSLYPKSFVIAETWKIEGRYFGVNIFKSIGQAPLHITLQTPFGKIKGDFIIQIRIPGIIEFIGVTTADGFKGNRKTIDYLKSV